MTTHLSDELALIGSLMYVREDFTAAIDLLAAGAVPVDEIITAQFDFEHSADAFTASANPENVKVIVTVTGAPQVPLATGSTSTGRPS